MADHVVRYETLTEGMQGALDAIGLGWDGWLPRAKTGTRKHSRGTGGYRGCMTPIPPPSSGGFMPKRPKPSAYRF
ncbi:MAG: hypothetical protein R3D78_09910 [Paracoccaceae bacterium]